MTKSVSNALLRFALGDTATHTAGCMLWDAGDVLGWGAWNVLKRNMYVQRRNEVWLISPGGERAAELLRKYGTVNPEV